MIKIKKICLLIPAIFLLNNTPYELRAARATETIVMPGAATSITSLTRKKINNLSEIVNDTKKDSNAKKKDIENAIKDLIDYNRFFSIILPKNTWDQFSEKEKQMIVGKYSNKYINDYFNLITDCKPLAISLNDNEEKRKNSTEIRGSYTCSGQDRKSINLSILNISGKIINIEINDVNFIARQKEEFKNALAGKNPEEIKEFLLKDK